MYPDYTYCPRKSKKVRAKAAGNRRKKAPPALVRQSRILPAKPKPVYDSIVTTLDESALWYGTPTDVKVGAEDPVPEAITAEHVSTEAVPATDEVVASPSEETDNEFDVTQPTIRTFDFPNTDDTDGALSDSTSVSLTDLSDLSSPVDFFPHTFPTTTLCTDDGNGMGWNNEFNYALDAYTSPPLAGWWDEMAIEGTPPMLDEYNRSLAETAIWSDVCWNSADLAEIMYDDSFSLAPSQDTFWVPQF